MNNSNFGIDCRNNIDNCILEPLYDEIEEISYIKKFCTIFGNEAYRDFFFPSVMREEICHEYNTKLLSEVIEQNLKKGRKKRKFQDIDSKITAAVDSRETKMILEFNKQE